MKLKNKRTGEIIEFDVILAVKDVSGDSVAHLEYGSLAELNAEWGEYEEPEDYWYVSCDGRALKATTVENEYNEKHITGHKQIGNYFETKEEAEKAVEKLKAWKLLKDECKIKFDGIIRDHKAMLKAVKITCDRHEVTFDRMRECMNALNLLFGGEE